MKTILSTLLVFVFFSSAQAQEPLDEFTVVAFGDMPYFLPEDYARFDNVIAAINKEKQAFTVHVGDIKSGSTACTDEAFRKIYNYFLEFERPLIYTPGDNEWTDCYTTKAGSYDPEERLSVIRKMFFKESTSFGKSKINLIAQSENSKFSKFTENKRWDFRGISFGTVHLVGSNNNFLPTDKNHNREFYDRDEANIDWLRQIFTSARQVNSAGIVIFTQADMFNPAKESSGFVNVLEILKKLTIDYGKPVVLVNGDSHKYIVDKPLLMDAKTKKVVGNFTRVQVFGEQDMHAVKLTFTPGQPGFFYAQPLIVGGN